MRFRLSLLLLFAAIGVSFGAEPTITWKKTVLDKKFRSEGVAIADVNKDGKIDVLNGEYWYEAPDWKAHEMKPPTDYKDGLQNYSHSFACWADDFNGDGFPDLIVIDFPGDPCYWLENPQGKEGHWKKHIIWHSACNETPIYADLLGTGKKVLLMGFQPKGKGNEGQMAYFTPNAKDPNALWDMHPISTPSMPPKMEDGKPVKGTGFEVPGTQKFSHGLGVGDVNNDGKNDVLCTGGWWEQPAKTDGTTPWAFHPANLGEACADMFVLDMDGDGKMDVVSSSAHKFGIWWHQQKPGKENPTFLRHDLFKDLVSETHAMHFVDIDGDGLKDLVTGKRFWSHGRSEPGSDKSAMVYWFKASKSKDGVISFTPMPIDDDSGIGTQFCVQDINGDGLLDVIVSNKKGVCVIEQVRK
ncbi:FG-GAP repeat domain-containing protein [Zavarzinella formosa]|uniref:FG-GAP repeat domain-containing protein n=1 Tax=Zavarzinella formosa TaxID=360055 RepID=UPI00031B3911|nr:VCBS repeat-containing protein [Zavarzinella formosa]